MANVDVKANGKFGRPPLKIDFAKVQECGEINLNIRETCDVLGLNYGTIFNNTERYSEFNEYWSRGRSNLAKELADIILTAAKQRKDGIAANPELALKVLKQVGALWSDKQQLEHSGAVAVQHQEHQEQQFDDETHTRLAIEWLRQHGYEIHED